jgi:hypothetical protein
VTTIIGKKMVNKFFNILRDMKENKIKITYSNYVAEEE